MPPRHTYWTIIFGNQPTAFRTATREELLPTFKQIQARHPDAVMMWFARGRLWRSEEEARDALVRKRQERRPPFHGRGPATDGARGNSDRAPGGPPRRREDRPAWGGPRRSGGGDTTARGRSWRPGGEHKDPRDRFKLPRDVKRARFKARLQRDRTSPRPPKPPKKKDDE